MQRGTPAPDRLPTVSRPIGIDYIRAGFAYSEGCFNLNPLFGRWNRVAATRRKLDLPPEIDTRGLTLEIKTLKYKMRRLTLTFSPNRVRWGVNWKPAMPWHADQIMEWINRLFQKIFPDSGLPPLKDRLWQVSKMDFSLDSRIPSDTAAIIANTYRDLGFNYGSKTREFYFCNSPDHHPDEDWDDSLNTGVDVRSKGKRVTLVHAFYYKFEEVFRRNAGLAHYLHPDTYRDEVRMNGRRQLRKLRLKTYTVDAALRFKNRTLAFINVMKRHGFKERMEFSLTAPTDRIPGKPGSKIRRRWEKCLPYIKVGDYEAVEKVLKEFRVKTNLVKINLLKTNKGKKGQGKNERGPLYNMRSSWRKMSAESLDTPEDAVFRLYAMTIFHSQPGLYAQVPDWEKVPVVFPGLGGCIGYLGNPGPAGQFTEEEALALEWRKHPHGLKGYLAFDDAVKSAPEARRRLQALIDRQNRITEESSGPFLILYDQDDDEDSNDGEEDNAWGGKRRWRWPLCRSDIFHYSD